MTARIPLDPSEDFSLMEEKQEIAKSPLARQTIPIFQNMGAGKEEREKIRAMLSAEILNSKIPRALVSDEIEFSELCSNITQKLGQLSLLTREGLVADCREEQILIDNLLDQDSFLCSLMSFLKSDYSKKQGADKELLESFALLIQGHDQIKRVEANPSEAADFDFVFQIGNKIFTGETILMIIEKKVKTRMAPLLEQFEQTEEQKRKKEKTEVLRVMQTMGMLREEDKILQQYFSPKVSFFITEEIIKKQKDNRLMEFLTANNSAFITLRNVVFTLFPEGKEIHKLIKKIWRQDQDTLLFRESCSIDLSQIREYFLFYFLQNILGKISLDKINIRLLDENQKLLIHPNDSRLKETIFRYLRLAIKTWGEEQ
jgi:hypothetical protein